MSGDTWVKNYRKLEKWQWYKRPHYAHLWQHLIRKAQFEPRFNVNGQKVDRGQVDFSIRQLSSETGVTLPVIRKFLQVLENSTEISTVHKGKNYRDLTIISITNYDHYQSNSSDVAQQIAQQEHSRRTVGAQQEHNFKKLKKEKKEKNTTDAKKFLTIEDINSGISNFIKPALMERLVKDYGKDLVEDNLRQAERWLIANIEKNKRSDMNRFFGGWMAKVKKPEELVSIDDIHDRNLEAFFDKYTN